MRIAAVPFLKLVFNMKSMTSLNKPAPFWPRFKSLVNNNLVQFSPLVLKSLFKTYNRVNVALLQTAFQDSPYTKVHWSSIRRLRHLIATVNKVHFLFLKKLVGVFRCLTSDSVLIDRHLRWPFGNNFGMSFRRNGFITLLIQNFLLTLVVW